MQESLVTLQMKRSHPLLPTTHTTHTTPIMNSSIKAAALGMIVIPMLSTPGIAQIPNSKLNQLNNIPRNKIPTADQLIDRNKLNKVRDLKRLVCDIEVSWRYSVAGTNGSQGYRGRAGGSGGSVRAPGTYTSNEMLGSIPVFKNVGNIDCAPWTGSVSYVKRVDGSGNSYQRKNYNTRRPLRPGEVFTGPVVRIAAPCPVGGGTFSAVTSRLRFDGNQRNNTYKLQYDIDRGEICPRLY